MENVLDYVAGLDYSCVIVVTGPLHKDRADEYHNYTVVASSIVYSNTWPLVQSVVVVTKEDGEQLITTSWQLEQLIREAQQYALKEGLDCFVDSTLQEYIAILQAQEHENEAKKLENAQKHFQRICFWAIGRSGRRNETIYYLPATLTDTAMEDWVAERVEEYETHCGDFRWGYYDIDTDEPNYP